MAMCVVAFAWNVHPRWRLVLAANRDEFHDRPATTLIDEDGRIGGRDLRSGGMWLGVSRAGRCAVVVNVAGQGGPDPDKQSRGALVTDALDGRPQPIDLDAYNPFSLIMIDHDQAQILSNRPTPMAWPLESGLHILSNGVVGLPWPRADAVDTAMRHWLDGRADDLTGLFDMLADDRGDQPAFIRDDIYGTRCSTIVGIACDGVGSIVERSFGPGGTPGTEVSFHFAWPA